MHPWLHFKTITRHKLLVMHYCFRAGMYKQGLLHDLSKYAPVEFLVGCKYYQGTRSPNKQREKTLEYQLHGSITKGEINIILSIG